MIGEVAQGERQQAQTLPIPVQADRVGTAAIVDSAQNRVLTRKEKAVLAVVTDPALSQATNKEKAKLAGVSPRHFYQIMADPYFAQVQRNECKSFVRSRMQVYLQAMDATAGKAGRDGFNDRRLAFEMGELYTPRQQVDHTTQGKPIVGVVGVSLDEL